MGIKARCGSCDKAYKVDDKFAGKKIKCKACGGVVAVPKVVAAVPLDAAAVARPARQSAAPVRSAPARQAPPPPPPPSDDPFDNLDALAALDQPAADQPAPEYNPRGRAAPARGPARTPPAEIPVGDEKLGPPVRTPAYVSKRGGAMPGAAKVEYETVRYKSARSISIPGQDGFDNWLPIIFIGGVVVGLLAQFAWLPVVASRIAEQNEQVKRFGFGMVYEMNWGRALGQTALRVFIPMFVLFAVIAPLCLLGVHLASRVGNFHMPANAYRRCATTAAVPWFVCILLIQLAFFGVTPGLLGPGSLTAWYYIGWALALGVLFLMLRLDLAGYGISAGFVLLFGVLVPYLIWLLIAAIADGRRFDTFGGPGIAMGRSSSSSDDDDRPTRRTPPAWTPPPTPPPQIPTRPQRPDPAVLRAQAEERLRKIHPAILAHVAENAGRYPASLHSLVSAGKLQRDDTTGHSGIPLTYNFHGWLRDPVSADYVLVSEMVPGAGMVCLFGDGRVEAVDMSRWSEVTAKSNQARSEAMRTARPPRPPGSGRPDPGTPTQNPPVDPPPTPGDPSTTNPPPPPPAPAGPPLTLTEKRIKSMRNLTRISAAVADYRKKNAGAHPDSLQALVDAALLPADAIASPFGPRSQYVTKSSKRIAKDLPANYVLAYDGAQTAEDPQQRAAVLWGNGKVEMVPTDTLLKAVGDTEKLYESLTK